VRREHRVFFRRQPGLDFLRGPHVELALLVLRVGVEGRVVAALGDCISRITQAAVSSATRANSGFFVAAQASEQRRSNGPLS